MCVEMAVGMGVLLNFVTVPDGNSIKKVLNTSLKSNYIYVHYSSIYNSQNVEIIQEHSDKRTNKEELLCVTMEYCIEIRKGDIIFL